MPNTDLEKEKLQAQLTIRNHAPHYNYELEDGIKGVSHRRVWGRAEAIGADDGEDIKFLV